MSNSIKRSLCFIIPTLVGSFITSQDPQYFKVIFIFSVALLVLLVLKVQIRHKDFLGILFSFFVDSPSGLKLNENEILIAISAFSLMVSPFVFALVKGIYGY